MNWAQRLEALRSAKGPAGSVPKVSKPPFGTFGTLPDGRLQEKTDPLPPDAEAVAAMRASLLAICRSHALPERLVANLPDAELAGCELLSPEGLVRWVQVLAENERMQQGIAPQGWNQASYCHHCGPVRLWASAPLHVIGCPWCHVRRAGGQVPRPAVTCATCTHQLLRKTGVAEAMHQPNTSDAGMYACAKGHGLHFAREQHTCTAWQPVPAMSTTNNRERLP